MKEQTKNKIKLIVIAVLFLIGMIGGLLIGYNAIVKPIQGG